MDRFTRGNGNKTIGTDMGERSTRMVLSIGVFGNITNFMEKAFVSCPTVLKLERIGSMAKSKYFPTNNNCEQ